MFTLNQALDAIKNKPEFSVKVRDDFTVIDYNLNTKDTFVGDTQEQSEILLNLRGTTFDNESGKIIRLAYHKFFNYGEYPEQDNLIDFNNEHSITQKLDGSMIAPIYSKAGTRLGTRAGITDVSLMAEKFIVGKHEYNSLIAHCEIAGFTPIFEYCSMENRVVLAYPESKLVLTNIRVIKTGKYIDYSGVKTLGKFFGIPVVTRYNSTSNSGFEELREHVKNLQQDEGVVVQFNDGYTFKMKADDYCLKHKTLDGLRYEKDVMQLVFSNALDDVIPLVSKEQGEYLHKYQLELIAAVENILSEIAVEFEKYAGVSKGKEFADAVKGNKYQSFLFSLVNNKGINLIDYCLKNCKTQTTVHELKKFLGFDMEYVL